MKDKIIIFMIGLLVGAIISASGFLIFEKLNNNKNTNQMPTERNFQMMERHNGEMKDEKFKDRNNDGTRPELPSKKDSTNENDKNLEDKKSINDNSSDKNSI